MPVSLWFLNSLNSVYNWLLNYLLGNWSRNWCCHWCWHWGRSSNRLDWRWCWNGIRFFNDHNLFLWGSLNHYWFYFLNWSCLFNRSRLWGNWSLSLENWRDHDWDWNGFLTCWLDWCCNLLYLLGNLLRNYLLNCNWLLYWGC